MKEIKKLQFDIQKWSDETFGLYRIATPITHHLKKEMDEYIPNRGLCSCGRQNFKPKRRK